jgi:hypothetical protein
VFAPDGMRLCEDDRFEGCSIVEPRVFAKRAETGSNDRAILRGVEEDVSRYLRGALKPVRIVKCSAVDATCFWKSLKIEK